MYEIIFVTKSLQLQKSCVPNRPYVEFVVSRNISSADDNVCEFDEYTAVAPDDTLATRINILKDQVRCYEQRAKFELTEHKQKNGLANACIYN